MSDKPKTTDKQPYTPPMRKLMDIINDYVDKGYHLEGLTESEDKSRITLVLRRDDNA